MQVMKKILNYTESVLEGRLISYDEMLELANIPNRSLPFLLAGADAIRAAYMGDGVDVCAIVNARSGRCTEDCRYCAQSKHYQTNVSVYPLLDKKILLSKAQEAEKGGAGRFALVTSGKGMEKDHEFSQILEAAELILSKTKLKLCCSLGEVNEEHCEALRKVGVTRYHHNIETSRNFYADICSTHSFEDRLHTIRIVKEAGLEVCTGGILGMGESIKDRIDMAFEIREMGVCSVPLNLLNPIQGTPMEKQIPLLPLEILKTFALFRYILPKTEIRMAGGRERNLRDLQATAFMGGINGIMVGGYLTTHGRAYADDMRMLADVGRQLLQ